MTPAVRIEVESCRPDPVAGRWRIRWRISNLGVERLRLDDAWVPHGRFRGEGHVGVGADLESGATCSVELTVTASEPPGTVVHNAFLILRSGAWRIFARHRIEFDNTDRPRPIVEQVTVQSLQ